MKTVLVWLWVGVFFFAATGFAASTYSSGEIDDDLTFEDFKIADGYLTGFIVNSSKRHPLCREARCVDNQYPRDPDLLEKELESRGPGSRGEGCGKRAV